MKNLRARLDRLARHPRLWRTQRRRIMVVEPGETEVQVAERNGIVLGRDPVRILFIEYVDPKGENHGEADQVGHARGNADLHN